jgi:hypothetical protein
MSILVKICPHHMGLERKREIILVIATFPRDFLALYHPQSRTERSETCMERSKSLPSY